MASTMPLEPQPWAMAAHMVAQLAQVQPRAAELGRHGGRQQLRVAHRGHGLVREAGLRIDVGGRRCGDFGGNADGGGNQRMESWLGHRAVHGIEGILAVSGARAG